MAAKLSTRVLMPLSLALNVFLVIVLVMTLDGDHKGPPPPPPMAMIERMADMLSPADAAILREALAGQEPILKADEASMREVPDRIRAALEAQPFVADALRAAFAEGRKARERMDNALEQALIEAVSRMSKQGRAALGAIEPSPPSPRP